MVNRAKPTNKSSPPPREDLGIFDWREGLCRNVIPRREPRNLKILRPAQSGTQDDSFSLRGACPACPERSLGELAEGLEMTNKA
jgi:hypothetical protein